MIHLIGGGRGAETALALRPFLASCQAARPRVATVLIDDGGDADYLEGFITLLKSAADCEPVPVRVPLGEAFDATALDDLDAMFVCGGLTPAYADALSPAAATIRRWVADGHPYAGFSAGAAIAAGRAIVGGWRCDGVPVCHEDTAEDLDELTVVDGLGLVEFSVDIHCAQWGTLTRAITAVDAGLVDVAIGIDEDTMVTVDAGGASVSGNGQAWVVTNSGVATEVSALRAGDVVELAALSS